MKKLLFVSISLVGLYSIALSQTNQGAWFRPTVRHVDTNALIQTVLAYAASLATNPPLSDEDFAGLASDLWTTKA